ncbi:hypothetical protein SCLCIDRAFT_28115 [Scleroderma citrinum Foug A]|uniref:Uncharacterized protein n=1 Tax=Scleroderma citrinum Foug A TaxID=1036808 RepID=A0A0C3DQ54_9AGAM|nr:hypothetical protein SCLCIDRAFT_28115 [Scleroderma citrinum Foug A]
MSTPTSSSTLPISENAIQPAAMESLHAEHIVAHVAQQLTSYMDGLSRSGNPDYWWKVVDVVWHELTLVHGVVNHLPAGFIMPTHLIATDHFMTDPVTVVTHQICLNIFIGLKHLELRKRKVVDVIPHAGYYEFKKDSDANDTTVQQYYCETYNIHIK